MNAKEVTALSHIHAEGMYIHAQEYSDFICKR